MPHDKQGVLRGILHHQGPSHCQCQTRFARLQGSFRLHRCTDHRFRSGLHRDRCRHRLFIGEQIKKRLSNKFDVQAASGHGHDSNIVLISQSCRGEARSLDFVEGSDLLIQLVMDSSCTFDLFHTTAREPKRAHLRVPALQTPPKFHEKTPRETQQERSGGGRGEKGRNFGSHPSGPHPSGPELHAFFFSSCCSVFLSAKKKGQKTETPILAKVGHPNFGQSRSN